jgi:glycosyltransferase involved in cell wall biosynthesis
LKFSEFSKNKSKNTNPRSVNILSLTFWSYKEGLIQTYTLPYLKQISKQIGEKDRVWLLTLEKETLKLTEPEQKKVKQELEQAKIKWIHYSYRPLGILAILQWGVILLHLIYLILFKNIQAIHPFCMPPSVAGGILAFLTRRKLVIDSYEPHAEASVENGDWDKQSKAFRFLFFMEKWVSKRAHTIVSATEGMRQYAKNKYQAEFTRFYVKPACVDLDLFSHKNVKRPDLVEKLRFQDKIVCVYAGKIGGIYLEQEIFDYLKIAQDEWGDQLRVLFLGNFNDAHLEQYANKSGFNKELFITKFVMHNEIPDYIGLADFALCPVKPIPTKRYCTPIKNGEYWALGLPVVITKGISDDSDIIENEKIGSVIKAFNTEAYKASINEIKHLLKNNSKQDLYNKIRNIAIKYRSFNISNQIYKEIYSNE